CPGAPERRLISVARTMYKLLKLQCFSPSVASRAFPPQAQPKVKPHLLWLGAQTPEDRVAFTSTEQANRGSFLARTVEAVRAWLTDHSDRSRAQRAAGTAFLIRVASAALVYLTQVLLARWMGSFEFGVYVYVWTWVLLLGGMIDFGLASSAQRFIPEYAGLKQF